jgi:hypothetical protein
LTILGVERRSEPFYDGSNDGPIGMNRSERLLRRLVPDLGRVFRGKTVEVTVSTGDGFVECEALNCEFNNLIDFN